MLYKFIYWTYIKNGATDIGFHAITDFVDKNPDWPDREILLQRAEIALLVDGATETDAAAWHKRYHERPARSLKELVRATWIKGDFDVVSQRILRTRYKDILRVDDDIARADRLLWEKKYTAIARMIDMLPASHRQMAETRIALQKDARNANALLSKVNSSLQNTPGLVFDRLSWRQRNGQKDGARALMLSVPAEVPYPEKWWPLRGRYIREAIDDGDYKTARKLLDKHGQVEGSQLAEALWLSGWLHLEFENKPREAYKEFFALFDKSKFPHSRARAAYWAGRAAEVNGNKDIAKTWYKEAQKYPVTFYGQVAMYELDKKAELRLPGAPSIPASTKAAFNKKELVQLVKLLARMNEHDRALRFVTHLADSAKTREEAVLVSALGKEIGRPDYGVKAGKKALQNDVLVASSAFPITKIKFSTPLEKPIILALTRQESEFNPRAVSPSNAMGMMQLLPSTAKEVAKRAGIPYSKSRLFEEQYNMELGSLYYSRLLSRYDGSYILAAAGYNAGPGNANNWLNRNGSPSGDYRKAITWIEMIPFEETRNYVQRVMENAQVYRHLLAGSKPVRLQIAEDLER